MDVLHRIHHCAQNTVFNSNFLSDILRWQHWSIGIEIIGEVSADVKSQVAPVFLLRKLIKSVQKSGGTNTYTYPFTKSSGASGMQMGAAFLVHLRLTGTSSSFLFNWILENLLWVYYRNMDCLELESRISYRPMRKDTLDSAQLKSLST